MVTSGYAPIARSATATVSKVEVVDAGHGLVEVRVEGANGETVDALYELVDEQGSWRINGVLTRPVGGATAARPDGAPRRGRRDRVTSDVPGARGRLAPLPLLTALAFLVQVDVRMMTPLLPTIAHSLGTSVTAMGLAMMLYMLPYGLCQFFYGPLGDRLGAIRVVRGAAIGFGVGTLLTGQAHHILALDAARFVTGVFAAAVVPLTFAYIGATVPYAERQGTLARFAAVTSLAQSLSAAIGGTVAHFVSWRILYVGVGCLSLVPAVLLFRTDTRRRVHGAPAAGSATASFSAGARRGSSTGSSASRGCSCGAASRTSAPSRWRGSGSTSSRWACCSRATASPRSSAGSRWCASGPVCPSTTWPRSAAG